MEYSLDSVLLIDLLLYMFVHLMLTGNCRHPLLHRCFTPRSVCVCATHFDQKLLVYTVPKKTVQTYFLSELCQI